MGDLALKAGERRIRTGGPPELLLVLWGPAALATLWARTPLSPIVALFLLAPLVLVPLVVYGLGAGLASSMAGRWAHLLLPIGAVAATLSFWVPSGRTAALLAAGWTMVCALAAIDGALRLIRGGYRSAEGICSSASLIYLFVGSVWLLLSRRGATPFHFSERTVLLAAVHFHFTGFALPVIAGATARARRTFKGSAGSPLFGWVTAGILVGPPLLAAGNILKLPTLKLAGALVLVVAALGLAGLIAPVLGRLESKPARALLTVSTLSLLAGMALVAAYAFREFSTRDWLPIPEMVRFHGTLNALGFALCGLLGWVREEHYRDAQGAPELAGS